MKELATTLLVCCCVATSSAHAIDCLSSPSQSEGGGYWSWREIDGRKCWYKKVGAVPPKSEFVWPDQAKEAPPPREPPPREPPRRSASPPTTEGMKTTPPRIEMARVKPVDITDPNYRLADGRIGLLEGFDLSGIRGVGGIWEVPPPIVLPLDNFATRYGSW